MDFNLNDILQNLGLNKLLVENHHNTNNELIPSKNSSDLTQQILKNIGIEPQIEIKQIEEVKHTKRLSKEQTQFILPIKQSLFQEISKKSPINQSKIKTQADVRQDIKNQSILQQFQRKQQSETRFQQIRDHVKQEMEAQQQVQENKLVQQQLLETQNLQNQKFIDIAQKQATKQIEIAKENERQAKCNIYIINNNLRQKIKLFNIIRNKYIQSMFIQQKLDYIINNRLKSKIVNCMKIVINNIERNNIKQAQIKKQQQLDNQIIQADDMARQFSCRKLLNLIVKFTRYQKTQKQLQLLSQERVNQIQAFLVKQEDKQKNNITIQQNSDEKKLKIDNIPKKITNTVIQPTSQQIDIQPIKKLVQPYKVPQKPTYLLQMEERELKRKEQREVKKQLEIQQLKQKEIQLIQEKENKKQKISQDISKANQFLNHQYLMLYPLRLLCIKSQELVQSEQKIQYNHNIRLQQKIFNQLNGIMKLQKKYEKCLNMILLSNFNLSIRNYQNKIIINILLVNRKITYQNNSIAENYFNNKLSNKVFYELCNQYRDIESQNIAKMIPIRNKIIYKNVIFTWKNSINLLKNHQKALQFAEKQIKKQDQNMDIYDQIISQNFLSTWESQKPYEKTFYDMFSSLQDFENEFIQKLNCFQEDAQY